MKVVLSCHGPFRPSNLAIAELAFRKGRVPIFTNSDPSRLVGWANPEDESEPSVLWGSLERNDPDLVDVVEKLGPEACLGGTWAEVIEIEDNVNFRIELSDRRELIHYFKPLADS